MRSVLVAVLAVSLLAAPAFAADAPPVPTTSLAGVPGGRYDVDAAHTSVLFSVNHLGYSNYIGRFNKVDGTFFLDNADPLKSTLKMTVDIDSIDTNHEVLEGKLKGEDWFDAKKFPTASFISTKVEKISDSKARVSGDFTLHGTTRPIVVDVTFNGTAINPFAKGQAMGFSATTTIKRSDYGIKAYVPAVGDEVKLTIETELLQAKD